MPLEEFHPLISDWFRSHIGQPTEVQTRAWPAIRSGSHTLIAAPTGSGKTLAAFLWCIDRLFRQALARELADQPQVLYISPLKALSNDVQKNLQKPLAEIGHAALHAGLLIPDLRILVRTGDTSISDRLHMLKRPPHILATTPESLFLLLTAEKSRRVLQTVRTVIVDEIHALVSNKRGAHLALSLERLDALTLVKSQRIGLSATQRPIELVAKFLAGGHAASQTDVFSNDGTEAVNGVRMIDIGHRRTLDLAVEVPKGDLSGIATNAIWSDIYDRLAELIRQHRSTLVFVNTRRLAERTAHHLKERLQDLGGEAVAAHHGSLSRQLRLQAEDHLKNGKTRAVIATASLELGIDIGTVDLVCQIGSPRAIAVGLQRVGRAGHWITGTPKGRLFALTRDELVECAALVRAIRAGILDRIAVPPAPLDILAQQIVAAVSVQAWSEDDLFTLCCQAYPYRNLTREEFDQVVRMLADGIATQRGRTHALVFYDRINRRLKGRRGAQLAALTSGGAIPDNAHYTVVSEPDGTVVGSVDEDFAVESLAGEIMLLGNSSWRIKGVEGGKVRVEDAHGAPPNIPFWRGEAPSRTAELSAEVSSLRQEIAHRLSPVDCAGGRVRSPCDAESPALSSLARHSALRWLTQQCGVDQRGAQQLIDYVLAGRAVLGVIPTQNKIVAERFFDESGGMQVVIHAPFGGRINRAWGLALRKRFCATFDFELQAAATDNGIVISLGERHSFPLETVFRYVHSQSVRDVLVQALLQAPMFMTRWRWNLSRALCLRRFANGKRVPPHIQRMRAEDCMAAVFPDALACQDNLGGGRTRRIPDHPLVKETIRDCLTEAMDLEGLTQVLRRIEGGEIECVAVDTPMPSPFSHEILNANPYAFLDDAPLEERRARAVEMRRTLPPELAEAAGALDPAAIEQVEREAWPIVRDADELHDALLTLIWLPEPMPAEWTLHLPILIESSRAVLLTFRPSPLAPQEVRGWVASENRMRIERLFAEGDETALDAVVLGWMESTGPTTADGLAGRLRLSIEPVERSLLRLEASGQILRGWFHASSYSSPPSPGGYEWCHRRLLARIHRLTVKRLKQKVTPVTAADFMRYLLKWHHITPESRLPGESGLLDVIGQLAGFEAPVSAWEPHLLRIRLARYEPHQLDRLCLSGSVSWGRLSPFLSLKEQGEGKGPRRIVPTSMVPICLFRREDLDWLVCSRQGEHTDVGGQSCFGLSAVAQRTYRTLEEHGACFFLDLVRITGHLASEVEEGLRELIAAGLVTADGFDNLRALADPHRRRAGRHTGMRRPCHAIGRWSLLRPEQVSAAFRRLSPVAGSISSAKDRIPQEERLARQFLRRYGVVFRDLLARETLAPSWRDLLIQYRRMEMVGEVQGGQFVAGFVGEQFALPEAIESLRAIRTSAVGFSEEIKISACDPLNLAGILFPGPRIPALATNFLILKDGIIAQVMVGRKRRDERAEYVAARD